MLQIDKVSYNLKGNIILNNISFFANKKEITAFVGESGAGKSSLLAVIAGLQGPLNGQIKLNKIVQEDFSQSLVPGNKKIKLVHQSNNLFPNISLRENLEYALRFYESNYRNKRSNYLEKVLGISKLGHRKTKEVSGGELQRWRIACAIAESPTVLLLDEPFSNLDTANKNKLKPIISEITEKENLITIFVSHDIQDVFGMANKVQILKKGRIIQAGIPEKVYKQPKNKYVAELTGNANILKSNFFGEKAKSKKLQLVRPEWLEITTNGNLKGKVVASNFISPYYVNKVIIKQEPLLFYSQNELTIGEVLNFEIKNKVSL